jgi:hypothetical protein
LKSADIVPVLGGKIIPNNKLLLMIHFVSFIVLPGGTQNKLFFLHDGKKLLAWSTKECGELHRQMLVFTQVWMGFTRACSKA